MPFARIGADGTFTALEIREGASGTAVSIGATGVDCSSVVETGEANCVSVMNNGMTLQCKSLVESAHNGSIDPPPVVEIDVGELGIGTHNLLDYPAGATISLTVPSRYEIDSIQNYSTSEGIQVEWISSQTCTFSMPQEGVIITVARKSAPVPSHRIIKDPSLLTIPGTVAISPNSARRGEKVTITIKLDPGVTDISGEISITDGAGKPISYTTNITESVITITFTMPNGNVIVSYK